MSRSRLPAAVPALLALLLLAPTAPGQTGPIRIGPIRIDPAPRLDPNAPQFGGPQYGPGGGQVGLADQLAAESSRFVDEVRYELAGTRQGRNLEIRGNALRGAVEDYRDELRLRHADESRRSRAFSSVDRALGEVHREINDPPGTAPRASASLRRIDRIASQLRGPYDPGFGPGPGFPPGGSPGFPPGGFPPVGGSPGGPGYDWRRVADASATTLAGVQDLQVRIDREVGRYAPYDGVLRDLDGIASGLDRLNDLSRRQLRAEQLAPIVREIRNQARRVDPVIRGSRPPFGVSQGWAGVRRGVDDLAFQLGVGGDSGIDPNAPVIINPPGYDQLPWPAPPGGGGGSLPPSTGAIPLIDRAIGELDGYLLAIGPNLSVIPEGPQFRRDAQELRNALIGLRQAIASSGWNPSVARQQERVDSLSRRLVDRTLRVGKGQIGPNNARILRVNELVEQLRSFAFAGVGRY